jgi:hypothetical protein
LKHHNLALVLGFLGRATIFVRLLTSVYINLLLVLIVFVRIRVTCGKWGTALGNARAVANATVANKSANMAKLRGRTTYPTGLARAGARTEAARRSVAKRDARIVYHTIEVYIGRIG